MALMLLALPAPTARSLQLEVERGVTDVRITEGRVERRHGGIASAIKRYLLIQKALVLFHHSTSC